MSRVNFFFDFIESQGLMPVLNDLEISILQIVLDATEHGGVPTNDIVDEILEKEIEVDGQEVDDPVHVVDTIWRLQRMQFIRIEYEDKRGNIWVTDRWRNYMRKSKERD